MKNVTNKDISEKRPPVAGKNLFSDIRNFFFQKPKEKTLVKFVSPEGREKYSERIMQRIGLEVQNYSVLNVHKISIDVPVHYIFDELLQWNGDSTCWPNHLARVQRVNNRLEEIEILLFGIKIHPFGLFSPLFHLNAIRIQRIPAPSDYDNARYLLYKCSGGYPIGIFSMYVRSSIAIENETGQSQLFMAVGFDFYGRKSKKIFNPLNKMWEFIHDRVTTNTLNRFKQLCEWRFEKMKNGIADKK
jgi:hypothetical protein